MNDQVPPRTKVLERAEVYIYVATAAVLVFAAAGLLVAAVIEMAQSILVDGVYISALLKLLDRALLVLMMAEIIYTVARIAKRKRIEVQPFLIVGVIAAVRRMLVITAESSAHVDITDPAFQAALAELGLLAVIIVALVWSMRLVPTDAMQ